MEMYSTEINNVVAVETPEGIVVGTDGKLRSATIIGSGSQEMVFRVHILSIPRRVPRAPLLE
jgi:hypothetical protein